MEASSFEKVIIDYLALSGSIFATCLKGAGRYFYLFLPCHFFSPIARTWPAVWTLGADWPNQVCCCIRPVLFLSRFFY